MSFKFQLLITEKINMKFVVSVCSTILINSTVLLASTVSTSFQLEGEIYQPATNQKLLDSAVKIKVSILNPSLNCILYEQEVTKDTVITDGRYQISVGTQTGSIPPRTSLDFGNSMVVVFQNAVTINGKTAANANCSYSPSARDPRYLRITVTPSSTNTPIVLTPDMELGSFPTALIADTVGGYSPSQLAILGNGDLTQANLQNVFATGNAAKLLTLLTGDPATIVRSSSGALPIPTLAGTPSTPAAGQIWLEGTALKYWDGSAPQTLGTSSLDPNDFVAKNSLTSGQLFVGSGTNQVAAVTPSGDVGVTNLGVFSVTGLRGVGVSSTAPTTSGQMLRYDGSSWTPGFVAMTDLRSSVTGTSQLASNCGSNQTLTYNSVGDVMVCTNISLPASQMTGTLAVANGGTGTTTGSITGSSALDFQAGGSNQNITFTPSGTGSNIFNGNVGIGTTSPMQKLEVAQTASILSNNPGSVSTLLVSPTPGSTNAPTSIALRANNGTSSSHYSVGVLSQIPSAVDWRGLTVLTYQGDNEAASDQGFEIREFNPNAANTFTRFRVSPGGNVGIGTSSPTSVLHLKAGTSAAGTAPLKLTAGTNLTTPEDGAMEYDGLSLYFTVGSTRRTLSSTSGGTTSDISNIANPGGSVTVTPAVGNSLIVASSTPSTSASTGALIVQGGAGVSGDIYSGGAISASTSLNSPVINGGTSASQSLTIDSTSNGTKGNILIAPTGGSVGIGTTSPSEFFHLYSAANAPVRARIETGSTGTGGAARVVLTNTAGSLAVGVNGTGYTPNTMNIPNFATIRTDSTLNGLNFGTGGSDPLNFYTNDTQRMTIDSSGKVGIGSNTPGTLFDVVESSTLATGSLTTSRTTTNFTPASASTADLVGTLLSLNYSGTENWTPGTTGSSATLSATATNSSSATASNLNASYFRAMQSGAGTSTTLRGVYGDVGMTSGTVVNSYGVIGRSLVGASSTATVSNLYGVGGFVQQQNTGTQTIPLAVGVQGTITNSGSAGASITSAHSGRFRVVNTGTGSIGTGVGVYIDSIAGTTNYGLYQSDAANKNYFAGNVGIGTTDATRKLTVDSTTAGGTPGILLVGDISNPLITANTGGALSFGFTVSPTLVNILSTGSVGIGTLTPGSRLDITETKTNTNGTHYLQENNLTVAPASNSTGAFSGFYGTASTSGASDVTTLIGTQGRANHAGSGTVSNLFGSYSQAVSTGPVTSAIGAGSVVNNFSTATMAAASGVAGSVVNNSTGLISAATAVRAVSPTNLSGTITNTYGVYIESQTAGTQTNTPFGLYQAGTSDRNYFAGSVGIGTTSPSSSLEVLGVGQTTADLTDSGSRGDAISLIGNGTSAGTGGVIYFGNSQSKTAGSVGMAAIKGVLTNGSGNTVGDLVFSTRSATGNSNLTEKMRVMGNGNVGIGSSTPSEKLDVSGSVRATSFITTSDRRLKKQIATVSGLDLITQLRGVKYQLRNNNQKEFGVIAQEVEQIIPDLVVTDPRTGFKAVKYQGLIAPMIEAIKEIKTQCDQDKNEVKQQLQHLAAENQRLSKELQVIQQQLQLLLKAKGH